MSTDTSDQSIDFGFCFVTHFDNWIWDENIQRANLDAEYLHQFLNIGKNNSKRYCLSFKTVFLLFQNVFLSVISNPKFNIVSIQCLSVISNPKLIISSVLPVSWLQYLTWAVKVQMPKMSLGRSYYKEIVFIIIIFHNWIVSIDSKYLESLSQS